MKKTLSAICLIALTACTQKSELSLIQGFAQGTTYHITIDLHDQSKLSIIEDEIKQEFLRLDQEISNYRSDSRIEKFNANLTTEIQETSEEIVHLIEIARKISTSTEGCYDITMKPLFDLWGFKKDVFHFPSDEELEQTRSLIGMDKLETIDKNHLRKTIPNLRVDLSSLGQGYSVARIASIIESHHITNYLVEIGGELKTRGKKPNGNSWRIAMEKPISTERKVEKIAVFETGEPMSLMPSGTYRHFFDSNGKRYSHILDARTGKPIEHHTALANAFMADSTLADAWSTALLCVGSQKGLELANKEGIAALFVDQIDGKLIELSSKSLESSQTVRLESP